MKATLITRLKVVSTEACLTAPVVWRFSEPVPSCHLAYKDRPIFVGKGARKIGLAHERRGHCHVDNLRANAMVGSDASRIQGEKGF
uniref:Uncharacterized protein n=1 Tax=Leptospirillum ferriphilum TaxID=178606 RepID=A0A7C3QSL3_9BACT